jgi:hypothetical protein
VDGVPTHAQLGSALRAAAASSRRFGDEHKWRAAPGSKTAATWKAASDTEDPLHLTLTEADVQAVLLVRSALAHAEEVGRAISVGRPFLPHSVGRIAVEHALRALHLTDQSATPAERAARRFDDLLYAITEGERQRASFAKRAQLPSEGFGDMTDVLDQVERRRSAGAGSAATDDLRPCRSPRPI